VSQGHGRRERREVRVSNALAGYSTLPGLGQVAQVTTQVTRLATGQTSTCVRYLVTSLSPAQAPPARVLSLSRGHWGIENRLFHVKDDSFGEDRHVLQTHAAGTTMSLLRATAIRHQSAARGGSPVDDEDPTDGSCRVGQRAPRRHPYPPGGTLKRPCTLERLD